MLWFLDISLPSDQYDIMADESIGKLYADKAIVEGIKLGVTKIQLMDQSIFLDNITLLDMNKHVLLYS